MYQREKWEREKKTRFQTFNDGVCHIYKLADVSIPGYKPQLRPKWYRSLPFGYKTIGVRRNYEAMQAAVRLDEMIIISQNHEISPQDIVVIEGVQYDVKQVQHKNDTAPRTTLISLQRLEEVYDDLGIRGTSS